MATEVVLSVEQAARLVGTNKVRLYRLIKRGLIVPHRVGGGTGVPYFDAARIDELRLQVERLGPHTRSKVSHRA